MNTPWFFLSYASIDRDYDQHVENFFSKLLKTVRWVAQVKASDFPDEDIGFCALHMSEGTIWDAELCHKLNSCGVLVCLYSDAYFKSKQCGKEFEIFRTRLNNHTSDKGTPARIIPVLWLVEEDFDESYLPTALEPIHYKCSGFEDAVNQGGIFSYLAIHANNPTKYDVYVRNLARRIFDAVHDKPELPPLRDAFDFETTVNAFADYSGRRTKVVEGSSESEKEAAQIDFSAKPISLTKIKLRWNSDASIDVKIERRLKSKVESTSVLQVDVGATEYVDSGLRPATTYVYKISTTDKLNGHTRSTTATVKTLPIPILWYMLVAASLLIIGSVAFTFRCSLSPRFCTPTPTPTPTPLPISEKLEERFHQKPNNASGWLKDGDWEYPVQAWSTVPGRDGDQIDRALLVKGATPGFTKDAFDNFDASFTISHVEGTSIGWYLRAQKKDDQIFGYRFVLRKRSDNSLFLDAIAEGAPFRRISPPGCYVPVLEYKKRPDDDIEVKVKAIGNQISYTFLLSNPHSEQLPNTKPVGCEPFKAESTSSMDAGYIGFFAEAGSVFKVEDLFVHRMK